jgi:hypothetical protein
MKSVLLGLDFLKTEDGIKFLEMNTDVGMYSGVINHVDFSQLNAYLISNPTIETLRLIYKIKNTSNIFIENLQSLCDSLSIDLEKIVVAENSITIPFFEEDSSVFTMRLAYDVTAIVDDTYCRDKSELLKLIFDSNNQSIIPKSQFKKDDVDYDNLTNLVDNGIHPNIIIKKMTPDFIKSDFPAFYKVETAEELDSIKTLTGTNMIAQEYTYNPANLYNNRIRDYIRYWVLLLSDLSLIELGGIQFPNALPMNAEYISYTENKLDKTSRIVYFNNPIVSKKGVPATYEVIKIVNGVEEETTLGEIEVGDVIKSVILPNLSNEEDLSETLAYQYSGSLNDIQYSTASVMNKWTNDINDWVLRVRYSNETLSGSSLFTPGEHVLIKTAEDIVTFKQANTILETDAILNSNSTTSNIDSIEWELYSGSIVNINIEPADVFVFGTNYNDINETISNTHIVHNKWSDIRLKENIKLVGQSKTGINVYQFSYIGESDLYEGVIAQELLGTEYESAAILSENDLYKVDYSQLDVEFKKIK